MRKNIDFKKLLFENNDIVKVRNFFLKQNFQHAKKEAIAILQETDDYVELLFLEKGKFTTEKIDTSNINYEIEPMLIKIYMESLLPSSSEEPQTSPKGVKNVLRTNTKHEIEFFINPGWTLERVKDKNGLKLLKNAMENPANEQSFVDYFVEFLRRTKHITGQGNQTPEYRESFSLMNVLFDKGFCRSTISNDHTTREKKKDHTMCQDLYKITRAIYEAVTGFKSFEERKAHILRERGDAIEPEEDIDSDEKFTVTNSIYPEMRKYFHIQHRILKNKERRAESASAKRIAPSPQKNQPALKKSK